LEPAWDSMGGKDGISRLGTWESRLVSRDLTTPMRCSPNNGIQRPRKTFAVIVDRGKRTIFRISSIDYPLAPRQR
jgi:hypothetical protein